MSCTTCTHDAKQCCSGGCAVAVGQDVIKQNIDETISEEALVERSPNAHVNPADVLYQGHNEQSKCMICNQQCCSGNHATSGKQGVIKQNTNETIFEEALGEQCPNANVDPADILHQGHAEQSKCVTFNHQCCSGNHATSGKQGVIKQNTNETIFEEALAERCPNADINPADILHQGHDEQSSMPNSQAGKVQRQNSAVSKRSHQTSDEFVQGVIRYHTLHHK